MMDFLEYELKIDFETSSQRPARVFYSMAALIEAFQELDFNLISLFDFEHEATAVLGDIQTGSLKTKVKTVLECLDDNALQDGNWHQLLGRFIHRVKYRILDWCDRDDVIDNPSEVREFVREINARVQETRVQFLPEYRSLHPSLLIAGIH